MLRGFAIVLMFVFHFSFDLDYFGVVNIQFLEDVFWLNFRLFIVSLFLLLVGISLHLATRGGICWRSWSRRMALLLVYAGLVSLGSWMMFPETFIYFGILHFIALASILGLLFTRFYWLNLLLGTFIILLDINYSNTLFNAPYLQWFGLMTRIPATEDYVPLLPWFGVVLIGVFIGKTLFDDKPMAWLCWNSQHPVARGLAFGGRHSLNIYMLHQPVFIGLLSLWFWMVD
jgi:uncharacterized membrane protein